MHVLFVAPDTAVYNRRFVEGLVRAGARVSGVGHAAPEKLPEALRKLLAGYSRVRSVLDDNEVLAHARTFGQEAPLDRVETIDEPVIECAARVRKALDLPGLTPEQAHLCRDKQAMKDALRAHAIPCAASCAATDAAAVRAFVEREGFPVVLKPRTGFGTLDTYRVDGPEDLERVLGKLKPAPERSVVCEEFIEGHEGFYDTITAGGRVAHDFVGHYYPTCLEALQSRDIRPQIACTNRIDSPGYQELRVVGQRVIDALGLVDAGTHMEWFFGPKGLRVSEIGARPAGERIWDMHAAGNEFDLYLDWARTMLHGRTEERPSRRYAVGSVQIRPERDGRYRGHDGLREVHAAIQHALVEYELPRPGAPTHALDKGWHVNTWFRLRDPDYDRLRELLDLVGRTVKARAH